MHLFPSSLHDMDSAPPHVWKAFMEFMEGLAAARELHARAGTAGAFIECVCVGASLVDAILRVALVLQHQLDNRTRDIPLDLIFQGPSDRAISERDVYKRAQVRSVVDRATFDELQALYDDRNRVIHRYIISRITTAEVLDIAIRYEAAVQKLSATLHAIEARQIEEGVGITVRGPAVEGPEDRKALQEFADNKHTPFLAKVLRGS